MHQIITAKNTTLDGNRLLFGNLVVAIIDKTQLVLNVPRDRAAQTRINQLLKLRGLDVVLQVGSYNAKLVRRGDHDKVIQSSNFPEWNDIGATARLSLNLVKKAAPVIEELKAA
jgi:hypothetical protein